MPARARWLLQPMSGQHVPGAERMFERLYRVLREVEARPRDSAELLTRLLRDLFEPLEVQTLERPSARSRVLGDGSALLVPLPTIDADQARGNDGSIVLRFRRARQAHVLARRCPADRPRGRATSPRRGLRQGGGAGPQRGARAHRAGPARRHRCAAADADVQGADAGDGGLHPAHAEGPEDADARTGQQRPAAVARRRRMEDRHRAAPDRGADRAELDLQLRPRHRARAWCSGRH